MVETAEDAEDAPAAVAVTEDAVAAVDAPAAADAIADAAAPAAEDTSFFATDLHGLLQD